MKIVVTSYVNTREYNEPLSWLDRINFHTGTLEELAKHHEVVSIEQINYSGTVKRNGVTYQFLDYGKPKLYFPYRLHRSIRNHKPDVVWVHGLHFPLQLIQLRKTLKKSTAIIVQNHAEKPHKGWRQLLQKRADTYVSHYLFTSTEMGQPWVQQGIIKSKQKIAEVMEASSVFADENCVEEKEPFTFLWVGRLDRNKDPLTVVNAFLKFSQLHLQAKLYMIFHEEDLLPEINQELATTGGEKNIVLLGRLPHNELLNWYQRSSFFISGSHYEGSGIAVCEAMSCGCIPIVTNIASFRKMTNSGQCGLLYEAGNEEELFQCLQKAMSLSMTAERDKVLHQFQQELSFTAIAARINRILDDIAGK